MGSSSDRDQILEEGENSIVFPNYSSNFNSVNNALLKKK